MPIHNSISKPNLNLTIVIPLGRMPYAAAWELQKRLHGQVSEGALPNLLLLLEHPHVYTLGRRGKQSDILIPPERLAELGVEIHHIDRGGEVTYHGPGQLVGYPIINLRGWGGPLKYIQTLEKALSASLAELGIHSESLDRPTGVWVNDAKIAAIGVRISRSVTMHGFALNVNPDLSYFDNIIPCGLPESAVTSVSQELSRNATVQEILPLIAKHFGKTFGWQLEFSTLRDLKLDITSTVAN